MGKDTPRRKPREYFYAEILQLPPGTRRPDHYTLLGLHYFEADHDTILRAALSRIRLLETCEVDPRPAYRKMAATLIGELRDAQMTLLDPHRRRTYDATLIGNDDSQDEAEEDQDKEAELGPGAMVQDRYRVMREVRQGGFGVVYEAMDKNLRSRVHLSVLRPRLSRERRHRRRVENATRAAAGFEHPNVVRLDEVGQTDGLLFTRSRAFEGKSVLELIEATPHRRFEVEEARRIGARVAEALQAAHESNVVHGDLRPHNVFLDGEGRVLICDFVVSRAVADESGSGHTRYREPENDPSQAGDAFAFGCLLQQMLTGEPPHEEPRPLPDDVPAPVGDLVAKLLATDPATRPSLGDAAQTLTASGTPGRNRLWIGAAALLVVVAVTAVLGWGGGDDDNPGDTVREVAWKLIAQNRFSEAIEKLERARAADPADDSLIAPLASAYERSAEESATRDDPWAAQMLLAKAQELEPTPERQAAHERAKGRATARLAAVKIVAPEYTDAPSLHLEVGDVPIKTAVFPGATYEVTDFVFKPELDEGAHEIAWTLVDKAGNRREGVARIVVDRTPPKVTIVSPDEGAFLRKGLTPVVIEVVDANNAASIKVRGREVPLRAGKAVDTYQFGDGEHVIDVVATDRAGHTTRAERRVIVDSKAPELKLDATRIVTRGGRVTIRGTVSGRAKRVTVDGRTVTLDGNGAFTDEIDASSDRQVTVEATSPTGLTRRQSVDIVVDRDAPSVEAEWERKDSKGVLLYGSREMDARGVKVRLAVSDRTRVSFKPAEGVVADGVWTLAPHQGKRKVRLVARDEAGNETAVELVVEGHRAKPRLVVNCNVDEYTRDDDVLLEVDADAQIEVLGKVREPGRIKLPLAEGRRELVVRAVDRYGNESRWSRVVVVDRTPPEVRLLGEEQRGIGKQELEFEANEPIATLTCFAKTWKVAGTRAKVTANLKAGRKNITVRAKDLAGNAAKVTLPLRVQNRVMLLDGKSGVVVRLPKDQSPPSRFTVECWVRGEAPQRTVAVFSNYNRSGLAVMWSSSQSRVPYAVWYAENSGRLALSVKKTWKWSEWVHVALCYDGKRMRFYVDGSLQGSMELREVVKLSGEALWIGTDTAGRYGFRGAIDEFRVSSVCRYTRGFTPQKFLKADDDTLALIRFDTMAGKTIPDVSGNNRHAVPFGNARLSDDSR